MFKWFWTMFSLGAPVSYNTSRGNPKFNVSYASRRLFPDFLRTENMVRVIEGKLYRKWPDWIELTGVREFLRVRVTEGKITVNVWRKSRGNRVWFELASRADKGWAVKRALRSSFNVWCGVGLARALFPRFRCASRPAKFSFLQTGNPIFFL